jgi:hypothetical protein
MTKVLLAVPKVQLEVIRRGLECFEETTGTKININNSLQQAQADAQKMVEALIKETEQNTAKEIFADIGKIKAPPPNEKLCKELIKHPTMIFASGWIRARFDVEQLREKYIKGDKP